MALPLSQQLTSKAHDLSYLKGHVIDGTKGEAKALLFCTEASARLLHTVILSDSKVGERFVRTGTVN